MTKDKLLALSRPGRNAVKRLWRPFLAIQVGAFLAVMAYYFIPGIPQSVNAIAQFKSHAGMGFSALSTALAGVFLPEIARRATMKTKSEPRDLLFQAGLYALIGTAVDVLYQMLAKVYGTEATLAVVIKKLLTDMFGFTVLVSMPLSTVAFLWHEHGYRLRKTVDAVRNGAFLARYAPLLIMCWGYWFPVLVAVYILPSNLQFVMYLFAQGAWTLLLVSVATRPSAAVPSSSA